MMASKARSFRDESEIAEMFRQEQSAHTDCKQSDASRLTDACKPMLSEFSLVFMGLSRLAPLPNCVVMKEQQWVSVVNSEMHSLLNQLNPNFQQVGQKGAVLVP